MKISNIYVLSIEEVKDRIDSFLDNAESFEKTNIGSCFKMKVGEQIVSGLITIDNHEVCIEFTPTNLPIQVHLRNKLDSITT